MTARQGLKCLFGTILATMICYTAWAATRQPLLHWTGLTRGPDRYWTIATLLDAYFGFLTFYVWVFFKERRWFGRIAWFVAIMLLGNMAMSVYMLLQLRALRPGAPLLEILSVRNP